MFLIILNKSKGEFYNRLLFIYIPNLNKWYPKLQKKIGLSSVNFELSPIIKELIQIELISMSYYLLKNYKTSYYLTTTKLFVKVLAPIFKIQW